MSLAAKLARGQISGLLAVAIAVMGGAAFVTIGGVLADTGLRSHPPVERLPGAEAVVTAPQSLSQAEDLDVALPERRGLPETLVERLDDLPEVDTAVGDIGFPAAVATAEGATSGADPRTAGRAWSSTALLGSTEVTGTPPRNADEVALDAATASEAGVEVGDQVPVTAAGQTSEYRLSAVVDTASSGIFLADAAAAELAGRTDGPREGTVDLVGVSAAPGVSSDDLDDAVRGSIGAADSTEGEVYSGAARGDAETPAAASARTLLLMLAGSFSGVVLVVIGFTVAGAVSISVAAQRRQLALLRAIGATPRQIRRLVLTPNLLATLVALPFGIGAGYVLASQMHGLLAGFGLFPPTLPMSLGPLPAVAAAALLSLTVWISVLAASAGASNVEPATALVETAAEPRAPRPWRLGAGAALLLASVVLSVSPLLIGSELAIVGTAIGSLVAVIGLGLAGPALLRMVSGALARRLPATASPLTWLAVRNLHGHSYRVAGAVASLAMVVTFLLGYGYSHTTLLTASADQKTAGELADYQISASQLGGLPDGLASSVRDASGVAAAVTSTPTSVVWPSEEFGDHVLEERSVQALGPDAGEVLDLGVTEGDLDRLTGDTVALGASFAGSNDAEVGDRVSFHMGDGAEVEAEVVALYERELGYGPVTLSRDLASGHVTGDLEASLLVRAESGEEPGEATETGQALARVAQERPGVEVTPLTASGDAAGGGLQVPAETMINLVVLVALLGYMLLSVANRLAAQTLQRGPEVTTLRAVGMTPGQVRSLLRRESLIIAVGAIGAGVLATAIPLLFAGIGLLGRPWPGGPVWPLPTIVLVVALLAWLCVEFPGRRLAAATIRR
ncbi:putative ABC transport system permease protein [Lipingzhangella halophila]|uniref:Putative ABC transport system permease protein n=1 Tax=Lipingzhangella halophila TaxID=1783352 RepID=A0A7W7RPD2_9ACTN|nr:ABC transporter permease [Lipingzhangella halophila]MBB4935183.1 putative ABC transport system permease protein [Lipingzhangella halophila]